jgi:hypothetical protein
VDIEVGNTHDTGSVAMLRAGSPTAAAAVLRFECFQTSVRLFDLLLYYNLKSDYGATITRFLVGVVNMFLTVRSTDVFISRTCLYVQSCETTTWKFILPKKFSKGENAEVVTSQKLLMNIHPV